MQSWEDERPIYEKELTAEEREAQAKAASERLEKECERGRKTVLIMMSLYVGMILLGMILNLFVVADAGQGTGYLLVSLPSLGIALLIAYNLYNGKEWAKVIFAILLGLSILLLLGEIGNLDIGRTDYSRSSDHITLIYSNGEMVESWELDEAELAKMQNREDVRAMMHRIVLGIDLVFLAVRISYFYLLFFYHPVKEFLYAQETKRYGYR